MSKGPNVLLTEVWTGDYLFGCLVISMPPSCPRSKDSTPAANGGGGEERRKERTISSPPPPPEHELVGPPHNNDVTNFGNVLPYKWS